MSKLSDLIKDARTGAKLTQEELARAAGSSLSASDISKAERGLSVPTDTQLRAIAKACGVTQKSLLDAAHPSSAKKTSTAKKTAAKKTSSAAKTSSAKKDEYTLTATEKKLIDAYRSASQENRKLAMGLLTGKDVEQSGLNVSSLLSGGIGNGLTSILENLIGGLGK